MNLQPAREPRQRTRRLLIATAGIALLWAGSVVAQEAADEAPADVVLPTAGQTSSSAKPGKNGKVCEYEVVTGSRMRKRICHTPEQWEARQRAGKELTRELEGTSISADGSGG